MSNETCRYFDPTYSWCRFSPPAVGRHEDRWPQAFSDDWCGSWSLDPSVEGDDEALTAIGARTAEVA